MVAFAVGGLLGDTFFHLIPEIFLGEDEPGRARFVLLEPNRNLLLGVAVLVGFLTFVAMDKGLRVATGGQGHAHDHGHGHGHAREHGNGSGEGKATGADAGEGKDVVRRRKGGEGKKDGEVAPVRAEEGNTSVKLAGVLNMMCVGIPFYFLLLTGSC